MSTQCRYLFLVDLGHLVELADSVLLEVCLCSIMYEGLVV